MAYVLATKDGGADRTAEDLETHMRDDLKHPEKLAFTVGQFCNAVGFSRRTLYTLWERNQGPPRFNVGSRVLIPREGAEAWLRDLPAA